MKPRMDTDEHGSDLAEADLTRGIIGASFDVLNALGHGLREKTYENALIVELNLRGLGCEKQQSFPVFYKDIQVDDFIPDLVVAGRVVVDAKTVEKITEAERGQMINYLRITRCHVGLVINFKKPRLEWERVVL
jgi:GxxExxY protein